MLGSTDHPFMRPLWRRVLLVAFCAAWATFEFIAGSSFWATLVGGMAVLGAWQYLITYKPAPDPVETPAPAKPADDADDLPPKA